MASVEIATMTVAAWDAVVCPHQPHRVAGDLLAVAADLDEGAGHETSRRGPAPPISGTPVRICWNLLVEVMPSHTNTELAVAGPTLVVGS